ncbi:MAG: peptidoglycan DD-metalloendopeptidase family protein [Leptospiraceae bacterium]|nr:peptidoglycan DD-metalloendopeptidase family protein [Leptospiraceae bacterium]
MGSTHGSFWVWLIQRSKRKRKHNGIDFICEPGQVIVSPVDGIVIRQAFPYTDKNYSGVLLGNDSLSLKMFYFIPDKKVLGKRVKQGDRLGIAQDISKRYSSKDRKMIPHIHLQIECLDPTVLML